MQNLHACIGSMSTAARVIGVPRKAARPSNLKRQHVIMHLSPAQNRNQLRVLSSTDVAHTLHNTEKQNRTEQNTNSRTEQNRNSRTEQNRKAVWLVHAVALGQVFKPNACAFMSLFTHPTGLAVPLKCTRASAAVVGTACPLVWLRRKHIDAGAGAAVPTSTATTPSRNTTVGENDSRGSGAAQKHHRLRPYQTACIEACLQAAREGVTRQAVSLPVGSGKTVRVRAFFFFYIRIYTSYSFIFLFI